MKKFIEKSIQKVLVEHLEVCKLSAMQKITPNQACEHTAHVINQAVTEILNEVDRVQRQPAVQVIDWTKVPEGVVIEVLVDGEWVVRTFVTCEADGRELICRSSDGMYRYFSQGRFHQSTVIKKEWYKSV